MKLLPQLPKGPARPVLTYDEIKEEAAAMRELLDGDAFTGQYARGFALHNAQVNAQPRNFFVLHKSWTNTIPAIICNPRIIEKLDPTTFPEACLSFPHRPPKKMRRYWRVIVAWDEPTGLLKAFPTGLRPREEAFDGLAAIVWQHECEHSHGHHIHDGRK